MANSLGLLNATLICAQGLSLMLAQYPLIGSIVTDFSDTQAKYGQTLTTRLPSVGTAQDFDPSTGFVAANVTGQDVSLTLNKFKHATFNLSVAELSATNRNLVQDYAQSFSSQIGEAIMTDLSALFTNTGVFTNTSTVALASLDRKSFVIDGNTALDSRKIAKNDRFAILSPTAYGQLMKDDSLVDLAYGGKTISATELPTVHGVAIGEYSSMPTAGNLYGVVADKSAVVFASRVPEDETALLDGINGAAKISTVTDPKTGLSVQVRLIHNATLGSVSISYSIIYGVGVGNAAALQRFKSS